MSTGKEQQESRPVAPSATAAAEHKYTSLFQTPLASDKFAHITIAYLGALSSQQMDAAKSALAAIPLPAKFLCNQKETFFTLRGSVNVRKCFLLDRGSETEVESVYKRFAVRDPFMPAEKAMPTTPTFHITVKNEDAEKELTRNPVVTARKVAIKPLGPVDPVFVSTGTSHEQFCWDAYHREKMLQEKQVDRLGLRDQANRVDMPGMNQHTVVHYVMQYCLSSYFSPPVKTSNK